MNAEFLLSALSRFGDHPDRIQEFRKVVVGLSISGRLAGQSDHQTPFELLAAIEVRKAELFARREIAKPKQYAAITDEQLPPQFTDASAFVALGSVARIEKGQTGIQQAQPGPYPLVVTAAERSQCDHFDFAGPAAIIPLVSSTGHGHASINRLHYQEGEFALGTILAAIVPFAPDLISARFLFEYLSTFKDELLVTRMTGTANVTLSIGRIVEVPVPLVPPSAQRKVDELMALCDQLETAQAEREAGRDKLTLSTLAKLNEPDPETFPDDARLALEHLEPLTKRTDQIKQLRQTILNLAVRGRLVEQDPNDEPAFNLFSRVLQSRKKYSAERKIRGDKIPSSPDADLGLPTCWVLAALGQIAVVTDPNPSHRYPNYDGGTVPLLSTREFLGDHDWSCETAQLTTEEFWLFQKEFCNFAPGDIIFARKGRLGLPRYLPNSEKFTFSHTLFVVKPMQGVLPDYLLLQLRRDQTVQWLVQEMNQNTGVPTLGKAKMEHLPIALPPLAEQHRIVAKVDKLMALCDQLEASLIEGEQIRSKLLEALLYEAFEPAGNLATDRREVAEWQS